MTPVQEDFLCLQAPSGSTWSQKWCSLHSDGYLRVCSHRPNASQTASSSSERVYDLSKYDSLQTSGSWGASAGPFELTLTGSCSSSTSQSSSTQFDPQSASPVPASSSPTLSISPLPSSSSSSASLSPIPRSFSSMLPRVGTNGSLSSLFEKSAQPHHLSQQQRLAHATPSTQMTPSRPSISISITGPEDSSDVSHAAPTKKGAWSRLSRRLHKSGSNSGSDRSLNDRFVRDGQRTTASRQSLVASSPNAAVPEAIKLVLRAPSAAAMNQWAEAISQYLHNSQEAPSSISRASARRHQLALSVGPSILNMLAPENSLSEQEETAANESTTTDEDAGVKITNLMHAAGANARRRRTESGAENPRWAHSISTSATTTEGTSSIFGKRRLTRISSESSRRLSLIDMIDAARHSTGSGLSFRSNSISSKHNKADSSLSRLSGSESKRASLRSERRASSPMVLFNIFNNAMSSGGLAEVDVKASELEAVVEKAAEQGDSADQEGDTPPTEPNSAPSSSVADEPAQLSLSDSFVAGLGLSFDQPVDSNSTGPLQLQTSPPIPPTIADAEVPDMVSAATSMAQSSSRSTSRSRFESDNCSSLPSSALQTPETPQDVWLDAEDDNPIDATPRASSHPAKTLAHQPSKAASLDDPVQMPPPKAPFTRLTSSSSSDILSSLASEAKSKTRATFARRLASAKPAKLASRFRAAEPTARLSSYEISAPTISAVIPKSLGSLPSSFSAMQLDRNAGQITPEFERPPPLLRFDSSDSNNSPIAAPKLSPRLGTERILPPEMMISRMDEISRLDPSEAALARRGLMEHGLAPHETIPTPGSKTTSYKMTSSRSVADFDIERCSSPVSTAMERPGTSMGFTAPNLATAASPQAALRLEPRDFAPVFSRRNRIDSYNSLGGGSAMQRHPDHFRSFNSTTRPRSPLTETTFLAPEVQTKGGDRPKVESNYNATSPRTLPNRLPATGGLPPPLRAHRKRPSMGLRAKSANILSSRSVLTELDEHSTRKISPRKISPKKYVSPSKGHRLSRHYDSGLVPTPIRSGTMGPTSASAARRRSLNRKSRLGQKRISRDMEADKENLIGATSSSSSRPTSAIMTGKRLSNRVSCDVKVNASGSELADEQQEVIIAEPTTATEVDVEVDEGGGGDGEDELSTVSESIHDAQIYQVTARLRPAAVFHRG